MIVTVLNPGPSPRRQNMAKAKAKKKLYRTSKGRFTTRKTGKPVRRSSGKKRKSPKRRGNPTHSNAKRKAPKRRSPARRRPAAKRSPSRARRRPARRSNPRKKGSTRAARRGGAKAIFGLPNKWTKWPVIGPLFREDLFFTGAGVSVGVGFIPFLEGKIIEATGLLEQEWYAKPDESGNPPLGKRALDTVMPAAVGGLVGTAAMGINNKPLKHFAKGFALAGVGLGLGRLLDWLVWSQIEGDTKPAATPPPGAKAGYLQAGMRGYLQAGHGMRGYLTARPGAGTYLSQGGSHGSFGSYGQAGQGEEMELGTMFAEQRTF
jgi:hypothetical protein